MSLLLLNTHNPSWQDRTVNVEVMLAPARNQLLMNKHKTLGSKCLKAQRLYEKERESMLKNILIEKRIMERKQQVLLRKKSEIKMNRVSSSVCSERKPSTPVSKVSSKRGGSAPAKLGWAESNTNKPSVFLTEVMGTGEPRSQSVATGERDKRWEEPSSPSHDNLSKKAVGSASQLSVSSRRVISPFGSKRSSNRVKSVRFNDIRVHETQTTDNYSSKPDFDGLVQQFVRSQVEFNQRPAEGIRNESWAKSSDTSSPLVAKRYSTLTINNNKLINAFDNFCLDKNKEDFQKLVRLASKLKSSVKMARNQSIVPSVAAFKSGKVFMEKIKKTEDVDS